MALEVKWAQVNYFLMELNVFPLNFLTFLNWVLETQWLSCVSPTLPVFQMSTDVIQECFIKVGLL